MSTQRIDVLIQFRSAPTASDVAAVERTYACTDLTCSFDGTGSTDSDGSINSHAWAFGDGVTATGATVSHTYAAGGSYTVTLTVTDDDGATGKSSQSVTVSEPSTGITLDVKPYKVKGIQTADLEWSGAIGDQVVIYRDGAAVATTANDGVETDSIGERGNGSHIYQVCGTGSEPRCSPVVTAEF